MCKPSAKLARVKKRFANRLWLLGFKSEIRNPKSEIANACCLSKFYGQAMGLISTGQLSTLLHLHFQPITSWSTRSLTGRTNLGSGFTLRCIQRLSMLHLATERYGWRHNSYTRGGSIPVLSY